MAEVDISKIKLPDGITYNLKSGTKGAGEVDISKIVLPDGTVCNIKGSGSEIFAHLYVSVDSGAVVTATSTEATYTATAGSGDEAFIEIGKAGVYTITATKDGCSSSSTTVNILEYGGIYNESVDFIKLTIDIPNGSDYAVTDGVTTFDGTSAGDEIIYYLPNIGIWTVSCTDGTHTVSETVNVTEYTAYYVSLVYDRIYGVSWDKSSSTKLTRTDDAVGFTDPDPYVADGQHPGSSPFDVIMPWAGIIKETFDGNVVVKIPKFWYKITNTSSELKIQIANYAADGFSVSPAHQDRNDGFGERDYVYIGRYICSNPNGNYDNKYKSVSGYTPITGVTRSTCRTNVKNNGSYYWLSDFAMFWTIRMLYLVEFADWNSQKVIGYGCGDGASETYVGSSDNMPYHTGTMQVNRTTYGVGCQYRYVEDLWGNVCERVDGLKIVIYNFRYPNWYVCTKPNLYNDDTNTTSYTYAGQSPSNSGCIKSLYADTSAVQAGLDWSMIPSDRVSDDTYQTYICDYIGAVNSSGSPDYSFSPMYAGDYTQNMTGGMFALSFGRDSVSSGWLGCRLQYLPPNS